MSRILPVFVILLTAVSAHAEPRVLVIVLDGLRPDYVTADTMPNLHGLAERGVFFEDHHAVFPTVTRVNSPSIATGCYPQKHGLMGNAVYFPAVNAEKGLSTSDANNLMKIDKATGGNLLTVPSMGEVLAEAGLDLLAVSSGSTGSAMLLNHKGMGAGMIHHSLVLPESLRARVDDALGAVPPDAMPNAGRNARAVDAYLAFGLIDDGPEVTFMWLSDPDHTAHTYGMGAGPTNAALRLVDFEIGRVLHEAETQGFADRLNIMVTSDHGFSTHQGGANVSGLLKARGLDEGVVVVGGAIYVLDHSGDKIRRIADALLEQDWVGGVFGPISKDAEADGPFVSYDIIHHRHERAPDILVSAGWSDEENEHGFKGTSRHGGVAGHGTAGYWDIHNTLIAAGPAFKSGQRVRTPTANVDIAPTVCRIVGVNVPDHMDGRVIGEALEGGPSPDDVTVRVEHVTIPAGSVSQEYQMKTVDGHNYLDWVTIARD